MIFVTLTAITGKVTYCFLSALSTEHRNTTSCGRKIENTAICKIGINSSCLLVHRALHQIIAQDTRLPPCLAVICFLRVVAWNEEVLGDTMLAVHRKNTHLLGVDEKLYYLYRSDDTEGIVIIKNYFRIRATQTELHYDHTHYILCYFTGFWVAEVHYTFS